MDRYEKALELARAYYDKDANTFLDTIFPELKESRDEQIRKAIIKSLDMPFPEDNLPGTDVTYAEAVTYLEKQKDHFRDDTKMVEQMLEWAKEKYEEYDRRIAGFPDDGAYWGQRNAFQQMIDKLNSI